eukprot:GHUV01004582.1.p1 GENE.GHUV01004582.1~~GHUV01004582.1.p1  ORF type:complete len:341 (+),score=87.36 GHUV01004582.1:522-1544(+)
MAGLISRIFGSAGASSADETGAPKSMHVKEVNIYPIKSCKGMPATAAACGGTGLPYDRQWMVVTADTGKFLTQRQLPKLCLVAPMLTPEVLLDNLQPGASLTVTAPGMPELRVPLTDPTTPVPGSSIRSVNVWEWSGPAADEGDEAAAWFSKFLDKEVRLVRFIGDNRPEATRPVDAEFAPGSLIRFPDGYPLLVATEESLTDLNKRLGERLEMNRFRPNIVISGAPAPWADDHWKGIQISSNSSGNSSEGMATARDAVVLQYVKPCDRCKVPTINQGTAEAGHDELERVLREVRSGKVLGWSEGRKSWTHSVFFGWNAAVQQQGRIAVGDAVQVIEAQA